MRRKPETISFWRGRLPHWEVVDGRYFVTIHLSGAIPLPGQRRIHSIACELHTLPQHDEERRLQVQRRVFAEMEAWLDRAEYANHLVRPNIAEMVVEAIEHREGREWRMFEYVVMPSHLHMFFELAGASPCQAGESRLKKSLEQFKRWTGHQVGRLLLLNASRFWQDEWFDHWSRSDEEDERIGAYIRRNPEKACLVQCYQDWKYSSWNR